MNSSKVTLIDPLEDARWSLYVNNHPYGTIYHHSCWMKVITFTYHHATPLCYVIEDRKKNIQGAIPCFIVKSKLTGTRIVSMPFTSYCDPLVDDKEDFAKLLDAIINELGNLSASYYELRALRSMDQIPRDKLKCHNYYKTHILDLRGGFNKIKQAFHKSSIVCTVRKAVKCGVKVREAVSEEDLMKFYFIHAITRKRHGFPIQPYRLFENMWKILRPQGYLTLLLAELDRTAIGGVVLFKFKDTVSIEHAGSIPKYLSLRPNHILWWRAVETACSEGYKYCDFGKSPPENKGLLDFKKRWGAEIHDLPYFYYPKIKGTMALEQNNFKHILLRSLGKHMPLSMAKIMGKIAYHHLG